MCVGISNCNFEQLDVYTPTHRQYCPISSELHFTHFCTFSKINVTGISEQYPSSLCILVYSNSLSYKIVCYYSPVLIVYSIDGSKNNYICSVSEEDGQG